MIMRHIMPFMHEKVAVSSDDPTINLVVRFCELFAIWILGALMIYAARADVIYSPLESGPIGRKFFCKIFLQHEPTCLPHNIISILALYCTSRTRSSHDPWYYNFLQVSPVPSICPR